MCYVYKQNELAHHLCGCVQFQYVYTYYISISKPMKIKKIPLYKNRGLYYLSSDIISIFGGFSPASRLKTFETIFSPSTTPKKLEKCVHGCYQWVTKNPQIKQYHFYDN